MSSTAELSYVNHIVKEYFNSILIIDDQLELNVNVVEATAELDLSNIDYGSVNPELLREEEVNPFTKSSMKEAAAAVATAMPLKKYTLQPEESYHTELMEEGFVTTPYKYNSEIDVAQVDVLANLLSNIKLLIVDWDLEDSKVNAVEPGTAATEILQKYASLDKGLKCAVIYTLSDDFDGIVEYLVRKKLITKRDGNFFENVGDTGHKLFGFIISKKHFKVKQIIPVISQKLLADKSLVLHFMDTASRINNNISRAMLEFSAPFEKVIFSQILTAKIPENDVPRFLTDKFLGNVLESNDEHYQYNFFVENKLSSLKWATSKGFPLEKIVRLILEIGSGETNKAIIKLFRDSDFVSKLVEKIQSHQQGLKALEKEICGLVSNDFVKRDLFLIIMMWDEFLRENGKRSLQNDMIDSLKKHPFDAENLNKISNFFEINLSGQFKRIIWEKNIGSIITDLLSKNAGKSFDDFKTELISTINNYEVEKEKLITLLNLWPSFFGDETEFSNSYKTQIYNFTKLMKFKDSMDDRIETGAIYYQSATDKYLLCITPYCDTFNTTKVESNIKFLVGRVEANPSGESLKNSDTPNSFYMAVPFSEDNKVRIIKWNFYEVITLHESDVKSDKLNKLLYLRKEYIQNVLNRYIAYQSRAGVDELFFKESSYINNFKNFI